MKFKIASVLELIVPLSVALILSAFLGCGGGGGSSYGSGTQPYDGTWSLNLKGYPLPPQAGASAVTCTELPTTIEMAHGIGVTRQEEVCANATSPFWYHDISVTITPDPPASGIGATVEAITFNGALMKGVCIDRIACQADTGLTMHKCGQPGGPC